MTLGTRYSSERKKGTAERIRTFPFDIGRVPSPGTHIDIALARVIGDPAFHWLVPFDRAWNDVGASSG